MSLWEPVEGREQTWRLALPFGPTPGPGHPPREVRLRRRSPGCWTIERWALVPGCERTWEVVEWIAELDSDPCADVAIVQTRAVETLAHVAKMRATRYIEHMSQLLHGLARSGGES